MKPITRRRQFLQWLTTTTGLAALSSSARAESVDRDLFGEPEHKLAYQFNKADPEYMEHVLFSVGAMLRRYSDDIHLVVTAIGPGIHILAKDPQRPVPEIIKKRVASLAAYGVSFHACGNTMKSLNWTEEDMLDFAEIVEIGADDLMQLQEKGYSYLSW
ncbi:DsrE family protein [Thiogranum longum]|jgi:intracellular sulfur oxidation DsrE/DsrF family protein